MGGGGGGEEEPTPGKIVRAILTPVRELKGGAIECRVRFIDEDGNTVSVTGEPDDEPTG